MKINHKFIQLVTCILLVMFTSSYAFNTDIPPSSQLTNQVLQELIKNANLHYIKISNDKQLLAIKKKKKKGKKLDKKKGKANKGGWKKSKGKWKKNKSSEDDE